MDRNDYIIALGSGILGFVLGCIWIKVSSKQNNQTQSTGKFITTTYDESGRLVGYLERPVDDNTIISQNYADGMKNELGDLVQAESGKLEGADLIQ